MSLQETILSTPVTILPYEIEPSSVNEALKVATILSVANIVATENCPGSEWRLSPNGGVAKRPAVM